MFNSTIIKGLGIVAMVLGFGADALGKWTEDKKLDETIERKVNEALAAKEESNNEEEES